MTPPGAVEPGPLGGQAFFGRSFVCGPDGALLASAGAEAAEVLVAALRLDEVRRWRELFPLLRCRRPAEYALLAAPALGEGAGTTDRPRGPTRWLRPLPTMAVGAAIALTAGCALLRLRSSRAYTFQ